MERVPATNRHGLKAAPYAERVNRREPRTVNRELLRSWWVLPW